MKRDRNLCMLLYTHFIASFITGGSRLDLAVNTKSFKIFTAGWVHEQSIICAVSPVIRSGMMALLPNGDNNLMVGGFKMKACTNLCLNLSAVCRQTVCLLPFTHVSNVRPAVRL
jgi:hypothetical protein